MGDTRKISEPLKQQESQGGRVMRQKREEESLRQAGGTAKKPINKGY